MERYLGESPVYLPGHAEFSEYTMEKWCFLWIEKFGGIDGAHHKDWLIDQLSQILHGSKVVVSEAKWKSGHSEYRYRLEPSTPYRDWVETFSGDYDVGIAP